MQNESDTLENACALLAEHYGVNAQFRQMMEECGELTQALNKWLRLRDEGQPVNKTADELKANIIEELADVEVMRMQVQYLLGVKDRDVLKIIFEKIVRQMHQVSNSLQGAEEAKETTQRTFDLYIRDDTDAHVKGDKNE